MKNLIRNLSLIFAIFTTQLIQAQSGTFYLQSFPAAPYPFDPYGGEEPIATLDADNHIYLVEDSADDYAALTAVNRMSQMSRMDDLSPGDGDGGDFYSDSFDYIVPTNGLWLEITNVVNGSVYLNLHHATNYVYEIYSKTDLAIPAWSIENEIFPTDANCMPFTVPQLNRTNLFIWARDWTGITSDGNTTPEWWLWEYFGMVNLRDTNLDSRDAHTLLYDYQHGQDPNLIQFSLQFTNISFSTSVVPGTIILVAGTPRYKAILINDTNTADAAWQPYDSTNITVNLPANGTYQVAVGLKGFSPDASQKWQTTSLTCFNPDIIPLTLVITNPAVNTVSVPMIQLQGLVGKALSSLTFDVSNALGVVTNQPGYWQPAFYNTNLLAFTTNTFQCYDIQLANGLNTITLHAKDTAGNTTTTNVSYTLDYSGDHTAPLLSVIWPTNGTSIAGSNITVQAQIDDTTANVTATISSETVQGLVERNGTVWFNNLLLNSGTNAITITATDAAGNISSTNLNVFKSAVSLTVNPVSSGQLNRTNITVTGTIGDSSEKIIVNGVTATISGNNWTATNVLVNPSGTMGVNVQVTDSSNNLLAVQGLYQPQPPTITMAAYEQTLLEVDSGYLSWDYDTGPLLTTSTTTYWANGRGLNYGFYQAWGGEAGIPASTSQINNNLSNYGNNLPVAWQEGDSMANLGGDWSWMLHTKTTLALQPAGQSPSDATQTYLVLVSALEYEVASINDVEYLWNQMYGTSFHAFLNEVTNTPLPPGQLQVNGQTLINSGITNADGSTSGLMTVSAPSGASVPLSPAATLANQNDVPVFQMQAYQLVSQCVATTPNNQARTNLGVGEQVNLSFNPALPTTNVTWSTTAGGLAVTSGITNLFTAPSNAANVTITATIGSMPVNFYYTVLEPSGVIMVTNGLRHTVNRPNIGIHTLIYLKPDSVNFGRVWCQEEQAYAVANGVYALFNGSPHESGPTPFQLTSTVVPGLGTSAGAAEDNIYSGDPGTSPPFAPGTEVYTIPWDFQVGGTNGTWKTNFTTLTHSCSLDASGILTASKGGASWSCNVTNASVSY